MLELGTVHGLCCRPAPLSFRVRRHWITTPDERLPHLTRTKHPIPMRFWRLGTKFNWKSAIAELGIIIAGVLIALGADSWWEVRTDRQRERAYLQQLLADVRETELRLQSSITEDSTHLARAARFLEAASLFHRASSRHGALPSADSLAMWAAPGYEPFVPLTGTYTALLQGSDMQLLRDDSIRYHIISLSAAVASMQEVLRGTEAQTWRNSELVGLGLRKSMIPPSGTMPWRNGVDAEALLQDPQVLNAVEMQHTVGSNRLWALRSLKVPTATLRRLLVSELEAH